jgi:hypothetical protein
MDVWSWGWVLVFVEAGFQGLPGGFANLSGGFGQVGELGLSGVLEVLMELAEEEGAGRGERVWG